MKESNPQEALASLERNLAIVQARLKTLDQYYTTALLASAKVANQMKAIEAEQKTMREIKSNLTNTITELKKIIKGEEGISVGD